MPVALIHTSVAALIAPGAHRLGGLGLDQLLEHQAHRAADQLRATTGAKRLPQLCRVNIRKGHRCVLLDEWVISLTEDHADGPPSGGPLRATSIPTTRWDTAHTNSEEAPGGGEPYALILMVFPAGVEILGVDDAPGGLLVLHIRTRGRPTCGGCGGAVWSKGASLVGLVDLPAFGRPVRFMWH